MSGVKSTCINHEPRMYALPIYASLGQTPSRVRALYFRKLLQIYSDMRQSKLSNKPLAVRQGHVCHTRASDVLFRVTHVRRYLQYMVLSSRS